MTPLNFHYNLGILIYDCLTLLTDENRDSTWGTGPALQLMSAAPDVGGALSLPKLLPSHPAGLALHHLSLACATSCLHVFERQKRRLIKCFDIDHFIFS